LLTAPGRRPAGSDSRLPKKGWTIQKVPFMKGINATDIRTKKRPCDVQ
jgi:hypothetical protein